MVGDESEAAAWLKALQEAKPKESGTPPDEVRKGFDPNEPRDKSGKWTAGGGKSSAPKIAHDHLGYSHGQHDFQAHAVIGDKVVGVLNYTLYDGELTVKHVEVDPAFRRRGISTQLYDSMLAKHPEATLGNSGMTPEGSAFRSAYNAKHPDRLTKEPQPKGVEHSSEEWDKLNAAVATAEGDTKERLYDLMNRMNDYDSFILSGRDAWNDGTVPEKPNVDEEMAVILGHKA